MKAAASVALPSMFHLVYTSTAVRMFSDRELFEMLLLYREKNARLNITGLLLYKAASFMQALEGDEAIVRDLYAKISEDPLHYNVTTIVTITVPERQFPDWSMGFKNLGDEDGASIQGYRPLRELPPWVDILPWRASVAMNLLATFNQED